MPTEHWWLQRETSQYLSEWLSSYRIPFRATRVSRLSGSFCLEVGRFQLWVYWRPLTVHRFDQMTQHFEGPHCPILASRLQYQNDEMMVYEGFDFNMHKNHRYQSRSFYFVIPEFLLYRPWPAPRDWRWQPSVKVSQTVVRNILWLELEYGGWPRNRRGNILVPKKTGCAGQSRKIEMGDGWATYSGGPLPDHHYLQSDLFNG